MELPIAYVGFAQSIFICILLFLKKPLKTADIILGVWTVTIACMFGLNIFQDLGLAQEEKWSVSLSISITYPPLLYLYSKYVTIDLGKFQQKDLAHILLPIVLIIILLIVGENPKNTLYKKGSLISWIRNVVGGGFVIMLWLYGLLALRNIRNYKRHIVDIYSYKSDRISLSWLLLVIISFILVYNIIIVVSMLRETRIIITEIDTIRDAALLIYVYVIGVWGFRQNQLAMDMRLIDPSSQINAKTASKKYRKSGLNDHLAMKYKKRLIRFMNESEAWKDQNLSVALLSRQTKIASHHITEVLNKYLGKNFYVFVNEYRVEYAKKLITSSEHQSMTFISIAYECGFNSKTAFYNYFKKNTGLTPSQYKANNL